MRLLSLRRRHRLQLEDLVHRTCDELLIWPLRRRVPRAIPPLLVQCVLLRAQHLACPSHLRRDARPQALRLAIVERGGATDEFRVRGAKPGRDVVLACEKHRIDRRERSAARGELADRVLANAGELQEGRDTQKRDPVGKRDRRGVIDPVGF